LVPAAAAAAAAGVEPDELEEVLDPESDALELDDVLLALEEGVLLELEALPSFLVEL
jgi:hypothetical protein